MMTVFLINSLVVAASVLFHDAFLQTFRQLLPRLKVSYRLRIVTGVFAALVAHAVEIWFFALAYFAMHHREGWGSLEGNFDGSLLDCGYFSFTVFTTLGFGDIQPTGDLRFLTGIESLTGLVLITWTASFLYLEMQRHWASNDAA